MAKEQEYRVCEEDRNKKGEIIPGKEIGKYKSNIIPSPGKNILIGTKKVRVRCFQWDDQGNRIIIIDPAKK